MTRGFCCPGTKGTVEKAKSNSCMISVLWRRRFRTDLAAVLDPDANKVSHVPGGPVLGRLSCSLQPPSDEGFPWAGAMSFLRSPQQARKARWETGSEEGPIGSDHIQPRASPSGWLTPEPCSEKLPRHQLLRETLLPPTLQGLSFLRINTRGWGLQPSWTLGDLSLCIYLTHTFLY